MVSWISKTGIATTVQICISGGPPVTKVSSNLIATPAAVEDVALIQVREDTVHWFKLTVGHQLALLSEEPNSNIRLGNLECGTHLDEQIMGWGVEKFINGYMD